jgi:hypothetical protein
MRNSDCTVLGCPQCRSKRAGIIRSDPPRAKCSDCSCIYNIATFPAPPEPKSTKSKRKATPRLWHRRDNGPEELEVQPLPPPSPKQLGTLTRFTREIIEGGPRAMIAAQHRAQELSKRFGEEIEAEWCLTTNWLKNLPSTGADGRDMTALNKIKVRYALTWRPRYLAALALSGGAQLACRAAKVSFTLVRAHRAKDPEFDQQCLEAIDHAIELLHDVTMQSAIEGECEPVFWQGIQVGHVRKVDNRVRIEMLRAHMPNKFKTPGSKVAISTANTQNNQFIFGPEEVQQLIASRQEALKRMAAERALPVTVQP